MSQVETETGTAGAADGGAARGDEILQVQGLVKHFPINTLFPYTTLFRSDRKSVV